MSRSRPAPRRPTAADHARADALIEEIERRLARLRQAHVGPGSAVAALDDPPGANRPLPR
ncbi:MAG TPA: hypothetical protein VF122_02635 [Caulobacteraceae bacterium]